MLFTRNIYDKERYSFEIVKRFSVTKKRFSVSFGLRSQVSGSRFPALGSKLSVLGHCNYFLTCLYHSKRALVITNPWFVLFKQ